MNLQRTKITPFISLIVESMNNNRLLIAHHPARSQMPHFLFNTIFVSHRRVKEFHGAAAETLQTFVTVRRGQLESFLQRECGQTATN